MALSLAAALAAVLVMSAPAWAAQQVITSAGPLDRIVLNDTLGCQVTHSSADPSLPGQFFFGTVGVQTCGTVLNVGGTAYSFSYDPTNPTSYYFDAAFTPVSQSPVTGSGTASDPYKVVTVVDAGTTGFRITETVTYVVGQETFRVDTRGANRGSSSQSAILYRFGDCYVGTETTGRDFSSGVGSPGGGAVCQQPPGDPNAPFALEYFPLSGGSNFGAGAQANSGGHINNDEPLADEASPAPPNETDSFLGLSWQITVPAGGSATRSLLTTASADAELPLLTSKTARDARTAAEGRNRYTITVRNRSDNPVTGEEVTDLLPPGFAYVAGSTRGSSEPRQNGRRLTFEGPFVIPANGRHRLSFAVAVGARAGTFRNQAGADAGNTFVLGTGLTAPIRVLAGAPPSPPCTIRGTSKNDVLRGTPGNDVICAGDGNDMVDGGGGNDTIRGGEGNDMLRGEGGDDVIHGGPGNDSLYGNRGADSLHARDAKRGNDVAHGGAGSDSCTADPRDVRTSC